MAKSYVNLASHTYGLHYFDETKTAKVISSSFDEMINDNNQMNEILQREQAFLAYPYGIYDDQAIAALKTTSIKYGFTIEPGISNPSHDNYQIPRVRINANTTVENLSQLLQE